MAGASLWPERMTAASGGSFPGNGFCGQQCRFGKTRTTAGRNSVKTEVLEGSDEMMEGRDRQGFSFN